MQKLIIGTLTILFLIAFFPRASYAKLLPQALGAKKIAGKSGAGAAGITAYPRLRGDRQALNVTFGNLSNATSVSYALVYVANGQEEGAGGSITPEGPTASRELLFGTCSKNVCRTHAGISNVRFEATAKLKNGKTQIKRYRIRY